MYTIFQFLYHFNFRTFLSQLFESLIFRTKHDDCCLENTEEGRPIIKQTIER